jgi:hypothetical protein
MKITFKLLLKVVKSLKFAGEVLPFPLMYPIAKFCASVISVVVKFYQTGERPGL